MDLLVFFSIIKMLKWMSSQETILACRKSAAIKNMHHHHDRSQIVTIMGLLTVTRLRFASS
jgi:hypothetical protein